ncbi:hypothetical protein Q8791_23185 [Nocardiopsis sp. CT-R113]|uniref:Uncharacterized protein n=1 Tax=Nocardiopsis codii TaxID=3065942 RepID=A0ABU7KD23_9ACTN|nr:hypothetical protein [Nocardiopsis sp. CT-R113]MEE2040126.1 hypothetical protein [Nocardiopsis sp. CT-R113]
MARTGYAKIYTRIWSDKDFIALPEQLQRGFLMLMSQGNLNAAGIIALQPRRWARFAADSTPESVTAVVNELEARRYVYADWDTEELLVRSYIRVDELWKQPNVIKGSFDDIEATLSDRLKGVLRTELERIPWGALTGKMAAETQARAAEVIASLPALGEAGGEAPKGLGEPSVEGVGEPFVEPFREGFPEPSGEPSEGGSVNPSPEPSGEPIAEPPVVVAVAVGVEVGTPEGSFKKTSSSSSETNLGPGTGDEDEPDEDTPGVCEDPEGEDADPQEDAPDPDEDQDDDGEPDEDQEPEPVRDDVERVCTHLRQRVIEGGKPAHRVNITKGWRTSARLLIDRDGVTEEQIIRAIDWVQKDAFWRTNVRSMPKLREKFFELRDRATEERRKAAAPARRPHNAALPSADGTTVFDRARQRLTEQEPQ